MNTDNIEKLIKRYSDELIEMSKIYKDEKEDVSSLSKTENESPLQKIRNDTIEEENSSKEAETKEIEPISEANEIETEESNPEVSTDFLKKDSSDDNVTSFATFCASVFSGEGTYPVENARVVVYRGDNIYAFLQTDENGITKVIQLPAYEKENSLQSDSPDQTIDYLADVFADGFITQKALLVSVVGGSEILLPVLMIPSEERIG